MTTNTPQCRCLACGECFEALTGIDPNDRPSEGDLIVCIRCGGVMATAHDLTVRGLSGEEIAKIQDDPQLTQYLAQCVRVVHFVRAVHERRN
jgi:hypothetical protein